MEQLEAIQCALIEAGCPAEAMEAVTLACVNVTEDMGNERVFQFLKRWLNKFPAGAQSAAFKRVLLADTTTSLREAAEKNGCSHEAVRKAEKRFQ